MVDRVSAWKIIFLFYLVTGCYGVANYYIGTGIADVTGPAAEVNMMGYANPSQKSHGIHMRLYSRAFIIADAAKTSRVVFVNVDACMISDIMKKKVANKLKTLYNGLYDETNVCVSGTHTHSGPGGYHRYVLFDVTSLGFVEESLDPLVDGIVKSIQNAHNNMVAGNIYINTGVLLNSNINRSPTAYLNNPPGEKAKYNYNVDKDMTVLKFVDGNGQPLGMISWFAVHCTSMNNTNGYISGDNKGYAAQLFEREMNPGSLPGEGKFIAAFAQSNEGDVSPNTKGAHCIDTGKPCDVSTSTCNGKPELCVASGPGKDMYESTKIIGKKQYEKAKELFDGANTLLTGPVDYRHQFVDMSNQKVQIDATHYATTCPPAMGYSFAAGTTDGPGSFDFTQGTTTGNPFWNFVRNILSKPSRAQIQCQHPKPILLNTGEMSFPYPWQPSVVPTQILRIGELMILAVPGEFSTMSGRRLRNAVTEIATQQGLPSNTKTVVAGLSNSYADYVVTYEEYQIQRYEGASTIYGPHTLLAFIQKFKGLTTAMAQGSTLSSGPSTPNFPSKLISFLTPVLHDSPPLFRSFGDVIKQPKSKYIQGDVVKVSFISANPRNNVMSGKSFLTVEKKQSDGSWKTVFTDADWETSYYWKRTSTILALSVSEISWKIPDQQPKGTYRIRHFGTAKKMITGSLKSFVGSTKSFQVV
ncbi:neutral ceramidase isoform X2 [Lingula anatina]|uniref:Neutral ceramidase n=1 Tax=Lingula anatina TaxID=7574 RepID=A0A1S3IXJ9_LINAN|nr:neutral ceramidase isoform X2 [Lingula anatina]|eukprot:XP_013402701.1 neutral ceramidase isoform X2 [Lingula anatina]